MIKFLEEHDAVAPFHVVRTRINNERVKLKRRLQQRKKDLEMDI